MKPSLKLTLGAVLWTAMFLQPSTLLAQGTAFTYQGRLEAGGAPANGSFDLRFTVHDAASGGNQWGPALTNSPVAISNGLFTVTLDFGFGVFNGGARWLEIGVRSNGTASAFTTLAPRQAVLPSPYSFWAANASQAVTISGTVPASGLNGLYSNPVNFNNPANSFSGNGAGLSNVNAAALGGRTAAQFWQTGGNPGTTPGTHFLGTTDNQPVEFKVNGQRALRLEPVPTSPNVLGGSPVNVITNGFFGAVIAGGGSSGYPNRVGGDFATVSGGGGNTASAWAATVSGGVANTAKAWAATVSGGELNTASGLVATVSGGRANTASGRFATVSGGELNTANGDYATVSGGYSNTASGLVATVSGGITNTASGNYATVSGGRANTASGHYSLAAGRRAKANHQGAFVWADSHDADFASTRSNQFNLRASGGVRVDTGSGPGISLNAADTPLITRGGDPFGTNAPASKEGHGRWGLFMEPSRLVLGIPGDDVPGRVFSVAKYHTDGTYATLMTVDQNGAVTATSFTPTSDRNAKRGFEPVDATAVLEKVARLPLSRWQFKEDNSGAWHLGPTAQDFHAAFGLGANDTTIATVDADGVALAAIQGLNEKVEVRSAKSEAGIRELKAENAALKAELEQLKQLVGTLVSQINGGAR
jgi:hypothetical protein